MDTTTLFPFERNRYYSGKPLTSADFQSEQAYMNNKRRFVNSLMFGPGVVCGLSVVSLDDLSFIIEAGAAIDALGREIVLDSTVVRQLSTVDGFESLESNEVSLCIRYAEEQVHPVYSINQRPGEGEYENNRIREGYELFLADKAALSDQAESVTEFLGSACLYSDQDFMVTVVMPQTVCRGCKVLLTVNIQKLTDNEKAFSMESVLQTPAFVSDTGEHEIMVRISDIKLARGETAQAVYWLTAEHQKADDSMVIAKPNFTRVQVDGVLKTVSGNFILKVAVTDMSMDELIDREVCRASLDSRNIGAADYIRLADFTLERTKSAYIIEKIEEIGVKKYISAPASTELRREYSAYFSGNQTRSRQNDDTRGQAKTQLPGNTHQEPIYASGICEIPLGVNARKGDIRYSGEIMHGLGKGNVHVSVGTEFLYKDIKLGKMSKIVIYGNADLFDEDGEDVYPIACAQSAVKVMNDRGSFIIAAKLLEDTTHALIVMRWVAVKLPAGDEGSDPDRMQNRSIAAEPPTVVLAFRENHFFNIRFKNMEPSSLVYELSDKNSGSITPDGVYTAPNKEGVYEICISCADDQSIRAYAYAVVKRNGAEDSSADG